MRARTLCLLSLLSVACNSTTATLDVRHRKVDGKSIATWDNQAITDSELKSRLAEMSPFARGRYVAPEQKKDYVDGLARFELLAQEAARRGLANEPEVVETTKKVLVQALLKQEIEAKSYDVPEADLQAYYEKHKADYLKPAMTRLSHIFFLKDHKARADDALREALALQSQDFAGFAKLAKDRSEEARTQPVDGDMRFLSDDDLSTQYGPQLVDAQKELTQVGSVLPRLVETDKGYHIIRLQGRQVALNLSLDQVKTQIHSTLLNELKQEHYRALLEQLNAKAHYAVDEGALNAIEVDAKAPATEAKGPPPGFAPPPAPKRAER